MTNEELAAAIGTNLREAERRAKEANATEVSDLLAQAHDLLAQAETLALAAGHVAARGGGTGKEDPPT